MEEDQKEKSPRKKRRISIFKRRKKSEIRPFVKEKKKREHKKFILYFLIFITFIFIISGVLYLVRIVVIPKLSAQKFTIVSPEGRRIPDNRTVIDELSQKTGITEITFPQDTSVVMFTLNSKTRVVISRHKDISEQYELVEAIDRQLIADGKQAISIDLRYNKPIVKF